MSIPQINIIEQLTPGHERFANDKVQKDVGVCVKKKSFPIKVSTANQNYDLSKLNFTVSLHYDNSTKDTVDYIEQLPLTYKSKLSKDKMSATIEVNILVLSSQMENSLFLIKVRAESKKDSKDFSECFSIPIKVVSKVTQLQTKAKKRTRNRSTPTKDMFISAMEKLDEGQEQHSKLLATLLQQSNQQTQVLMMLLQEESNEISNSIKQDDSILDDFVRPENVPNKRIKVEEEDTGKSSANNQLDFAFKDLFDSFSTLDDNFYGLIEYPSIVETNNNNNTTISSNNNTDPFNFSFEEEVISDSPNHISSHDHSEELNFEEEFPIKDQNKGNYNSIDFGSFPNLFDINNL